MHVTYLSRMVMQEAKFKFKINLTLFFCSSLPCAATEEVEEDTEEFLLNRKVTVKNDKDVDKEYRIGEFLGR